MLRGGVLTREAKELYVLKLSKLPLEDVLLALEKLGTLPRQEYETAIPDVGSILAVVNTCTAARQNRIQAQKDLVYVCWECRTCGHRASAFIPRADHEPRVCKSIYAPIGSKHRGLPANERCGAILTEVQRGLDA